MKQLQRFFVAITEDKYRNEIMQKYRVFSAVHIVRTLLKDWPTLRQGFSLASAIGHSPKIVPDVREFAVQFGQFVRDDFWKCTLYGYAQ